MILDAAHPLVMGCLVVAAVGGALIALCGMVAAEPLGRLLFPRDPALFAAVVRVTIWSLPLFGIESVMGYALNAAGADKSAGAGFRTCGASEPHDFGAAGHVPRRSWGVLVDDSAPVIRVAFLGRIFIRTFCQTTDVPALYAAA